MVAVSDYNVRAVNWTHGWELHVADVGVTQCRTLAGAEAQVRDFVGTMLGTDAGHAVVHLSVTVGGLENNVDRPGG